MSRLLQDRDYLPGSRTARGAGSILVTRQLAGCLPRFGGGIRPFDTESVPNDRERRDQWHPGKAHWFPRRRRMTARIFGG